MLEYIIPLIWGLIVAVIIYFPYRKNETELTEEEKQKKIEQIENLKAGIEMCTRLHNMRLRRKKEIQKGNIIDIQNYKRRNENGNRR